MGRRTDYSDKKFNYLKALSYAGKIRDKSLWEFICNCGNKCIYIIGEVTSGIKKSCGCHYKFTKEQYLKKVEKDLLEKKVDRNGCWEWPGQLDYHGYGRRSFGQYEKNKKELVHRISFQIFRGEIGKKHVLHTCDNTKCYNPDHLYLGTAKDNMRDLKKRGRPANSKINMKIANEIRKDYENGMEHKELMKKYKLSSPSIYLITRNKTWNLD